MTPEQNARVWALLHPGEEPCWGEWPEHVAFPQPLGLPAPCVRCKKDTTLMSAPCVVPPPAMDGPEVIAQILEWGRANAAHVDVCWARGSERFRATIAPGRIYHQIEHPDSPVEALKAALLAACGEEVSHDA